VRCADIAKCRPGFLSGHIDESLIVD